MALDPSKSSSYGQRWSLQIIIIIFFFRQEETNSSEETGTPLVEVSEVTDDGEEIPVIDEDDDKEKESTEGANSNENDESGENANEKIDNSEKRDEVIEKKAIKIDNEERDDRENGKISSKSGEHALKIRVNICTWQKVTLNKYTEYILFH